ncbi:hypothetical protein [Dactylosporangium darangshiense]|uniref:hypothetical protein n=1 Tax=Dactylosporangium darangshiense TaxID=579108 RepID=UPI00363A243C
MPELLADQGAGLFGRAGQGDAVPLAQPGVDEVGEARHHHGGEAPRVALAPDEAVVPLGHGQQDAVAGRDGVAQLAPAGTSGTGGSLGPGRWFEAGRGQPGAGHRGGQFVGADLHEHLAHHLDRHDRQQHQRERHLVADDVEQPPADDGQRDGDEEPADPPAGVEGPRRAAGRAPLGPRRRPADLEEFVEADDLLVLTRHRGHLRSPRARRRTARRGSAAVP